MKCFWVTVGLLVGCSAPYNVPTNNLGRPISSVKTSYNHRNQIWMRKSRVALRGSTGDTLFSIAWRFEQDPDVLKRRNELSSDLILPGQALRLGARFRPNLNPSLRRDGGEDTTHDQGRTRNREPQVKENPAPETKERSRGLSLRLRLCHN